jgi:uncharacterized protein (UPF0335 family)
MEGALSEGSHGGTKGGVRKNPQGSSVIGIRFSVIGNPEPRSPNPDNRKIPQESRAARVARAQGRGYGPRPFILRHFLGTGFVAMAKANFAKDQLKSLVERVERLEEEKTALSGDIRELYAEAKGQGFDTKIMRQVVRLRKMETHEREERNALLDLYMSALGMAS